MSAILFVAGNVTTYYKPEFKRSYRFNVEGSKYMTADEGITEKLKNEYNNLSYDYIGTKPFFGKGIRDYKNSSKSNEITYKDEYGREYTNHYCLFEDASDCNQFSLIIDETRYDINKGLVRIDLSKGVHRVELVCDFYVTYGLNQKRLKFNKTQYVYLRDGYNYFSISCELKEGYVGMNYNSINSYCSQGFDYRIDDYEVNSGITQVSFEMGIITHDAFSNAHIDRYYTYEIAFPDSDTQDLEDIRRINRTTVNDVLRVSNSVKSKKRSEEPVRNVNNTSLNVQSAVGSKPYTTEINNDFKQEYVAPKPKVKKYYDNPKLAEIMSAFNYEVYENGMVILGPKTKMHGLYVPQNVIKIGERAFMSKNAEHLATVIFSDTVTWVANGAFQGCEYLYNLTLNEGLLEISECAFAGCINLQTVKIPSTVKAIRSCAFKGTDIFEVAVPKGCYVHPNAFNEDTIVVYGTEEDLNNYIADLERKQKEQEALAALDEINKQLAQLDKIEAELDAIEEAEREEARQKELEELRRIEAEKRKAERERRKAERLEQERLEATQKEQEEKELYEEFVKTDPVEQSRQKQYGKEFEFRFNELIKYVGNNKKVIIPEFINQIRETAFEASNIEELIFSDDLLMESLGCLKLLTNIKKVTLPYNITHIPKGLFKNNKTLEYVFIPSKVTEIEDSAFEGCEALKHVEFGQDFTSLKIGSKAFKKCVSLQEVVLPKNTTIIGEEAFMNCKELDTLLLAFETEKILSKAFYGCVHLMKMVFPPKVHYFGDDIFYNCHSVEEVYLCAKEYMNNGEFPLNGLNIYTDIKYVTSYEELRELIFVYDYKKINKLNNIEDILVLHEIEREDLYTKLYKEIHGKAPKADSNKKLSDTTVNKKSTFKQEVKNEKTPEKKTENQTLSTKESPVFEIQNGVLKKYNGNDEIVTIKDKINSISYLAFKDKNIKKLIFSGSIKGLDLSQLESLRDTLEELIIGDSVEEISNTKHTVLKELKYVVLGSKISYIPMNTFSNYSKLEKIEFKYNEVHVSSWAFLSCKNLKNIINSESITNVDEKGFAGCSNLTNIKLPNIKKIHEEAFKDCISLKEIELGENLNYVGDNIFGECKALEKLYFNADPSCLKRIVGEVSLYSLLKDCTSLKELHHKCKRAELLPYLNDENGKPWRIPFKTIRIRE
jgi:hypothetical protein